MKTATVRDLRNRFPRVAAWIEQGEPVEITKGGKVFARLVPAQPEKPRRFREMGPSEGYHRAPCEARQL